MFNYAFILFVLGALGYVSGLFQKPWPRKVIITLFVFYLLVSGLKCKSDSETGKNPDAIKNNPSQISEPSSATVGIPPGLENTGNLLTAGNTFSYKDAINQTAVDIQKGDFDKALSDLTQASQLDTGNTNSGFIKVFRIQVLIDMRDFKKALGELLEIEEGSLGANERAWYFRYFKTCYLALGNVKKAYEYDEKLKEFQNPIPGIGQRTKEHGCSLRGQGQDKACTPGAVSADTVEEICSPSYLKRDRRISKKDKNEALQEYGMSRDDAKAYRVDYLIPIELGGVSAVANLWPEAVDSKPGYDEKKRVEKYLYNEVCAGRMSLSRAQRMLANNWLDAYKNIK